MTIFIPDLMADLIPADSAAGFKIGERFDVIQNLIGPVEWCDKDSTLDQRLSANTGWIGVLSKYGFPGGPYSVVRSLVYMNDVICLEFEESSRLYRIDVGYGYEGSFYGVRPTDSITKLSEFFDVEFNSDEDEFLIGRSGEMLTGISFITDYRASLEHAPEQTIQFISIHDWSLR